MPIIVPPCGPANAKLVIVGEAPGAEEERLGAPFVGVSGHLLDQFCQMNNINRKNVYITNVSKVRPALNDFHARYYTRLGEPTEELRTLWANLVEEIQGVGPNLTVALGAEALKALTGKVGIGNWRGSILDSPVGKVIPTYHPAAIQRDWNNKYAPSLFDFARISQDMEFPELRLPSPVIDTAPSFDRLLWAFETKIRTADYVAFDIETINYEIDCIGFSPDPDYSICVPLMYTNGVPYWSDNNEATVWKLIAELLANPRIGKIAQNANYDITYLDRHGCTFRNLAMDTMNAHHCCYPETPKGLDFLCSIYTRYSYYKDQSHTNRWEYNAKDAVVTRTCFDEINRELEELGTKDFYYGRINGIVLPYKEVADTGINIDHELKAKITIDLEAELIELNTELTELVGHPVNVGSPKQVCTLLYEELGLDKVVKRDTGNMTSDDDALQSLVTKYSTKRPKVIPILKKIQQIRDVSKELTTYARMKVDPDGRVRTTYYVSGTETGRLASQKAITETGANLQNVTKGELKEGCGYGIRSFFIPDHPGEVFLEGDLSGADARIVAWVSRDPGLLNLFNTGQDIHIQNASIFFQVAPDQVTKAQRQLAKKCGHAANYGSGPRVLAKEVGISESEAKRLLTTYLCTYPAIEQWHGDVQKALSKNRTLTTPLGRRRQFFGRWDESLYKEAYAYVPQSTVADIIHIAFYDLYYRIKAKGLDKLGVRVAVNVHDAIMVNCSADLAIATILPIMRDCMQFPIQFECGPLIIPADFQMGPNWHELSKVKEV